MCRKKSRTFRGLSAYANNALQAPYTDVSGTCGYCFPIKAIKTMFPR